MHDIRLIRDDPDRFDQMLARRGLPPVAQDLRKLDERRRALIAEAQVAQARRNEASKLIGAAMAKGDPATAEALKAEVAALKDRLPAIEAEEKDVAAQLKAALDIIPNLPADDVPDGAGEEDNVEVARWGTPRSFDFTPKEHADLAHALGMDFETGARLSGARFTFLRGDMARLHRALGQFMLDVQTREHGYEECNPPVLVKDEAMYGTDKLPKFKEDSFETAIPIDRESIQIELDGWLARLRERAPASTRAIELDSDEFRESYQNLKDQIAQADREVHQANRRWLIPTSEVSLTASVIGELLDESALPLRLTALTLCFRSEAGAAGRDTRGFIRQHQFEKCELVSIVRPEDSEAEHQRMTRAAETILERLNLSYRKLLLCTGDMGFGARKTYDLEVWLPGQGAWREISSCSNTGDFQARRMNTRYRVAGEQKKTEFVHTLNGSGLAVGRTLVAVIENYQNADGSVTVPDALLPYMGGITRLEPTP
ncbi:serine--tRNA ligase [Sphingomonas sp. SFZ2018-12]|uniref:serine--tRNA ligase n=1 Tax=Sphingomonas sp. SFZ2018-12 TaxID=2683197 RepID=UPI001F0DB704|nr:serine--tRNA ligase [Sphingomonas sp. SFZ2018-12]MCH4892818.1 serine--tRNA ligase [Sphingomonas sp. SFZ2018-12]